MLVFQQESASVFKFQTTEKREYNHRMNREAVLILCYGKWTSARSSPVYAPHSIGAGLYATCP